MNEAIKKAQQKLDEHRAEAHITCEETCWCWEIESLLVLLEAEPEPGEYQTRCPKCHYEFINKMATLKQAEIERLTAIMFEHHICAQCGKRLSDTEWRSVHTCYHYEPKGDSKG